MLSARGLLQVGRLPLRLDDFRCRMRSLIRWGMLSLLSQVSVGRHRSEWCARRDRSQLPFKYRPPDFFSKTSSPIDSNINQPDPHPMTQLLAKVEMLIHKLPQEVFAALCDALMLEKFWLKRASGPLARDAIVEWEFLVPGARETVKVTGFVANQVIEFEWSDGVAVAIHCKPHDQNGTRVSISATGFSDASQAMNATEGFAIVLCDLKSLLETGRSGNMVRDKAALIAADMANS